MMKHSRQSQVKLRESQFGLSLCIAIIHCTMHTGLKFAFFVTKNYAQQNAQIAHRYALIGF